MSVRSQVLARSSSTGGGTNTIGTVPANTTWIAKGISLQNTGGANDTVELYFLSPDSTQACVLFAGTLTPGQVVNPQVYAVADAGSTLNLLTGAAGVKCWVSGAALLS